MKAKVMEFVLILFLLMLCLHKSNTFAQVENLAHHQVKTTKRAANFRKNRANEQNNKKIDQQNPNKKIVKINRQRPLKRPKKIKEEKEKPAKGDESPKSLTGTFTMATNYLFRDISQTNNTPAFQGGLTYTPFPKLGVYFSLWGSNVYMHVPDPHPNRTATLEMDPAIGLKKTINDNWSYDIHLVRYVYPRASVFEYNELIASLTYSVLTGLIGYSNNVFNSGACGTYYNLSLNLNIPPKYVYFKDVSVNGGVGYYSLPKRAGNSYMDYSIAVNKIIQNYTLTIQATNTNHKLLNNSLDNAHLFGMVTASF